MDQRHIVVMGSYVADLAFRTEKLPAWGETYMGTSFKLGPGGKGSNQAVAAARAGAKVSFISKLAHDAFGDLGPQDLPRRRYRHHVPLRDRNSHRRRRNHHRRRERRERDYRSARRLLRTDSTGRRAGSRNRLANRQSSSPSWSSPCRRSSSASNSPTPSACRPSSTPHPAASCPIPSTNTATI